MQETRIKRMVEAARIRLIDGGVVMELGDDFGNLAIAQYQGGEWRLKPLEFARDAENMAYVVSRRFAPPTEYYTGVDGNEDGIDDVLVDLSGPALAMRLDEQGGLEVLSLIDGEGRGEEFEGRFVVIRYREQMFEEVWEYKDGNEKKAIGFIVDKNPTLTVKDVMRMLNILRYPYEVIDYLGNDKYNAFTEIWGAASSKEVLEDIIDQAAVSGSPEEVVARFMNSELGGQIDYTDPRLLRLFGKWKWDFPYWTNFP
jgi:hypothetical protein